MAPPSRDGHIAADEEGEPAEHLLLGQLRSLPMSCRMRPSSSWS
jgi:hypothetical protein